mmetsp:Transcript_18740/g.37797  ORF Transcript_18740/g.37797 Transcript_18740/m.37797 type:complete len:202 (-) Transcript_18740:39-644(-)
MSCPFHHLSKIIPSSSSPRPLSRDCPTFHNLVAHLQSSPDAAFLLSREGTILYRNRAAGLLFLSDVENLPLASLFAFSSSWDDLMADLSSASSSSSSSSSSDSESESVSVSESESESDSEADSSLYSVSMDSSTDSSKVENGDMVSFNATFTEIRTSERSMGSGALVFFMVAMFHGGCCRLSHPTWWGLPLNGITRGLGQK